MAQMTTAKHLFFQLEDIKDLSVIFADLEKKFIVKQDGLQTVKEFFFDTFDWRLYREELFFVLGHKRCELYSSGGRAIFDTEVPRANKYFWWSFTRQELQDRLEPILEYRALFPLVAVFKSQHNYRLTNKDGKTIARISTRVYRPADADGTFPFAVYIELKTVRGYESAFKKTDKIIRRHRAEEVVFGYSLLKAALENGRRQPLDYSSKYGVVLERDWSVGKVCSTICLYLLDNMKRNTEFILADTDTEFLHDFRVAVRRTRSFLSLMKRLLPEQTAHYMAEFKWLGALTGPVRDLDVYLLMEKQYSTILPKSLHPGLPYFFADLKNFREKALKKMIEGLRSVRFKKLKRDWSQYLTELPELVEEGEWHSLCRPEAVQLIHKRLKRIVKDGNRITDKSADECLHDLRIQAKKFRYLLEFFAPYFEQDDVKLFIKQLKKLQNNLGDFNDLSVQQGMLEEYQDKLVPSDETDLKIAASLGGLISHLATKQHRVRKDFNRTFKQFIRQENDRLFKKTFQA